MKVILRPLASPAMVVACLALVVALGGVSYAAGVLPKNSVGAAQIKKRAVTSAKVKDGSLIARDFKAGQLPSGPRGAKGDAGAHGPKGDRGAPGTARAYGRVAADGTLSRSKNVVAVTKPYDNAYCIKPAVGIDASQTGVIAMPDWVQDSTKFNGNGSQTIVEWRSDASACSAGQLEVITGVRQVSTGGSADGDVHSVGNGYHAEPFFFVVP